MTNMITKADDDTSNKRTVADVARPLRAVSQVIGSADHPTGTVSGTLEATQMVYGNATRAECTTSSG